MQHCLCELALGGAQAEMSSEASSGVWEGVRAEGEQGIPVHAGGAIHDELTAALTKNKKLIRSLCTRGKFVDLSDPVIPVKPVYAWKVRGQPQVVYPF